MSSSSARDGEPCGAPSRSALSVCKTVLDGLCWLGSIPAKAGALSTHVCATAKSRRTPTGCSARRSSISRLVRSWSLRQMGSPVGHAFLFFKRRDERKFRGSARCTPLGEVLLSGPRASRWRREHGWPLPVGLVVAPLASTRRELCRSGFVMLASVFLLTGFPACGARLGWLRANCRLSRL
jgi:hypothetical protein